MSDPYGDDDGKKPILPSSALNDGSRASASSSSKKKKIIGGVVGGLAVLGLILGLTLGKSSDSGDDGGGDGPGPGPTPVAPVNPYYLKGDLNEQTQVFTGVLQFEQSKWDELKKSGKLRKLQENAAANNVTLLDPTIIPTGENNQLMQEITFEIGQSDFKTSYLILSDAQNQRYSISEDLVNKPKYQQIYRTDQAGLTIETNPFSFTFTDAYDDNNELVTTKNSHFLMTDKYSQLDLTLPSQRIFGLGERQREFSLGPGTWTMWANNDFMGYDSGQGGLQYHGVHPFALVESKNPGTYFGVFFRNSNAQSPIIQFNEDGSSVLSYITTGGNIEMYFFWKGTAKQIISQYQNFIGKPSLPPFWSLGWHAGSSSYATLDDVKANVQGYKDAGIPLEGVWFDGNIMSASNFQVDTTKYQDLAAYQQELASNNQKMILSLNTGLNIADLSDSYIIEGQSGEAFIKTNNQSQEVQFQDAIVSATSNYDQSVFLDLDQSSAADLWNKGLNDLHTQTKFDGLSLQGNEVYTKCNGECPQGPPTPPEPSQRKLADVSSLFLGDEPQTMWYQSYQDQSENSTYNLPFIPYSGDRNLDNNTLSLNATQANGQTQYDKHSLYGFQESKATWDVFTSDKSPNPGKRPFLISSGTYAGSGQYVGHSLGLNGKTWDDLKNSTAGIMNFNMFGVPFSGADVCGSHGDAGDDQEQLCASWIHSAAFYPFARQYSDVAGLEPWNFQDANLKTMAQEALKSRLKMSRHLYTCLFEASDSGNTCFDPLLFHFPTDTKTFSNTEESFIFANALKVTQLLAAGVDTVKSYFPAGNWVSMLDYKTLTSKGEELDLPVNDLDHLMPGAIVVKQEGDFMTTADLKDNKFTFIANPDKYGHAQGTLYIDDGETMGTPYDYYEFQLSANSLKKWEKSQSTSITKNLDALIIGNAADLADTDFACYSSNVDNTLTQLSATADADAGTLTIKTSDGSPIDISTLKDIYWGNSANDINLCDLSSQYYKVSGDPLDLTGQTATATLTSLQTKVALPDLTLTLTLLKTGVVNIHWTVADTTAFKPFEVPLDIVDAKKDQVHETDTLDMYVELTNPAGEGALAIAVKNKAGTKYFNLNGMILSQYLNFIDSQAMTKLNSKGVAGLFERVSSDLFLGDGVYSLWSRDIPNPVETGKPPGNNLYGVHPFLMGQATDDTWFGVFTNLAAAQDWWIKYADDATSHAANLQTYASSGAGDIYLISGDGPNQVTTTYHTIVGTPVLVPQWALGWNQCKWGYNNTDALKAVVQGYKEAGIPLDTQWSDIDWMQDYRDFVYDPVNFKDLPDFVNSLHEENMHYIPIVDAGLAKRESGYEAYTDGVAKDVFIMAPNNEIFTGQVWPNDAAFPDFFKDGTPEWWQQWVDNFHNEVAFDGLWLDMNEASNFCTGVCYQEQMSDKPVKYKLPYVPTGRDLEEKSITLDAKHDGGITEHEVHSLFGTKEVEATHGWFNNKGKRTVIIERSSYAGMGKFGSRWLGDNFATPEYMGYSVTGIMGHNIMGIPLAGSDICGFIRNTTAELCARWHMVGAFYPFSRNHNSWDTIPQEPYQPLFQQFYEGNIQYVDIMKRAIFIKYSMIRYYYTELSMLSQNGGSFYKPLFFEFPNDANAYNNQEVNIMLGSALKLSIQSTSVGVNATDFYFPQGLWCDVFKTVDAATNCFTAPAEGLTKNLPTKANDFYVHLREGYMFPFQDASALNVKTSADLKVQPFELHILPTCDAGNCQAAGQYLNDDGESLDVTGAQNIYTFQYAQTAAGADIVLTVTHVADAGKQIDKNDVLGMLQIYNAAAQSLTGKFSVIATKVDGTTTIDLGSTEDYSAVSDRLVWKAVDFGVEASLNEIAFITLSAQA